MSGSRSWSASDSSRDWMTRGLLSRQPQRLTLPRDVLRPPTDCTLRLATPDSGECHGAIQALRHQALTQSNVPLRMSDSRNQK